MKCDETASLLADQLKGLLHSDDEARLREHLDACPKCQAEADSIRALWSGMDTEEVVVPHDRMRVRFHAALAAYDERARRTGLARLLDSILPLQPALQTVFAALLVAVGILIGRIGSSDGNEIAALRDDVRAMSIALLDHQSASERLLGVEWSARNSSSVAVANALLDVVRNDSSVNVRLAAVEALGEWANQPAIGAALVDALAREDAPMIQVTLVDLLLDRNVSGSRTAIEQLLASQDIDPVVREFAQLAIDESAGGGDANTI